MSSLGNLTSIQNMMYRGHFSYVHSKCGSTGTDLFTWTHCNGFCQTWSWTSAGGFRESMKEFHLCSHRLDHHFFTDTSGSVRTAQWTTWPARGCGPIQRRNSTSGVKVWRSCIMLSNCPPAWWWQIITLANREFPNQKRGLDLFSTQAYFSVECSMAVSTSHVGNHSQFVSL